MSEIRELRLDSIRIDPALQPRVTVDQGVVAEYADAMEAGDTFPAIVVFHDGSTFWLADGWHRVEAARSVRDKRALLAEVHEGTRRDALLYSLGANAAHGLRRSNEDKRKAVQRLLADPEWATWSDREIARVCRVSPTSVGNIRREVSVQMDRQRTFERGGTVATMNTAPIAAAAEARAAESVRTEPEIAEYRDLERAVYDYLGPPDAGDTNLKDRIAKLDALMADEFSEAFDEFEPYIGKPYSTEELQRCFVNVRHMLGDKLRYREYVRARDAELAEHAAKRMRFAPPLTPVERTEPETAAEPEPEPEPAAPRKPSAWAPDLVPRTKPAKEPIPDDVELTVTLKAARDAGNWKAFVRADAHRRGRASSFRGYGVPPIALPELYASIHHVLAAFLEPEVLALAGQPPDPNVIRRDEPVQRPRQQDPIPAGTRVEFSGKFGTLIEWKASGRIAEIEGEDGRRYSMPALMITAITPEPETA